MNTQYEKLTNTLREQNDSTYKKIQAIIKTLNRQDINEVAKIIADIQKLNKKQTRKLFGIVNKFRKADKAIAKVPESPEDDMNQFVLDKPYNKFLRLKH